MSAQEFQCLVESFRRLTPTVFELSFKTNHPLLFQAGQFISVVIPGAGPKGRDLRRAYSIASSPESPSIELCIKQVDGPGTHYLQQLRPGQGFKCFAPYGSFVYRSKPDRHVCFIATGTGIAPFRSMILSKDYQQHSLRTTTCLHGIRTEEEALYLDEFCRFQEIYPQFHWMPTVSKQSESGNWKGLSGRVTHHLSIFEKDYPWKETEFYLCGNGAMIEEVRSILLTQEVPKESIHQEIYYKPKKE